ncbi:MAG: hypothetical protein KDH94_00275, partial [Coxiellaceae bacterium]|nr:hypothetical protein [Coxiellaceae bacterium]
AAFLVKAQNYAEEKTKLYDMVGSVYMTCVTNPEHYTNPFLHQKKNPCHQFFRVMSDYAKKSKAFHDVSISDLKNIAVVKRLENLITAYQVAGGNRQQAHDYLKSLSH